MISEDSIFAQATPPGSGAIAILRISGRKAIGAVSTLSGKPKDYFKRSNHYWELENQRGKFPGPYDWHNDYVNQTYWMALDIKRISNQSWWPDFLELAIGFGLDDSQFLNNQNRKSGGYNEWYLAIDYNLPKLLKKLDSPLAKELKYWLNYIKFPAPTLRFSPTIEFYPFFM